MKKDKCDSLPVLVKFGVSPICHSIDIVSIFQFLLHPSDSIWNCRLNLWPCCATQNWRQHCHIST